ncbi:hypothetical protein [Pannonibacter tanglangensis]|uniref:Holin n=1 Tax=Pannonibacter tanglangensis TaxID=2750084 RepID=A0ABW9ZIL0_9HYPH|nr:hypothetical protein [Pannonibacter sp. XCT-34]NBN62882.1 hypothetical protein [Pannonibacter sp. XCT-34]
MSGWRTLLFNGGLGLAALIGQVLDQMSVIDWTAVLPPDWVPVVLFAVGVANVALRHVTTGPAGWRRAAADPAA